MTFKSKFYTALILVDVIICVFLVKILRESIVYGSQFGQDFFELTSFSLLILVTIYAAFLHFKFRTAQENMVQKIHFWTYILSIIAFAAPMLYYWVASLFIENANESIGFGVGLFYVGWSIFLGIIWIINTLIIGSIALSKYKQELNST